MPVQEMTSRERMRTALSGGIPDRVPAAPDISNMVPCRLTGRPFWDIYFYQNPSLVWAYIDAVNYYGMDGWLIDGGVTFSLQSEVSVETAVLSHTPEALVARNCYHTPDGDLTETVYYAAGNPPSYTEKLIKDLRADFKKVRHLFSGVKSYDASALADIRRIYGDAGLNSAMVVPPGFQTFLHYFDANLEGCTYAYYDEKELFCELSELHAKQELQKLDILLDVGYDAIMIGASGSVTLQSPALWDELTLPFVQKATHLCRQAGAVSGMHSCGIQQHLIRRCVEQTELDYVNPLEMPPMGDCVLSDIKNKYGKKIALMGNLHTTNTMLYGTADTVYLESLKCIRDAGENGGFVLSTGDQCGRDTPDENIFAMLRAAREFGTYPLCPQALDEAIHTLEKKQKEDEPTI